jgi:hypothetical protein
MAPIQTSASCYECDSPGCPAEFRIERWRRPRDVNGGLSDREMLDYARRLGWKVVGQKAFCCDCARTKRA